MSPTAEIVLLVFTGLVAAALLTQAITLILVAIRVRTLGTTVESLSPKIGRQVDSLTAQAESLIPTIKSIIEKVDSMQENLVSVSKVAQERAIKLDAFLGEATDAGRLQMARLQDVVDTTSRRLNDTIELMQSAISAPVNEIHAIMRGIRGAVEVFFGRRRSSSSRSHQDEEMFI